MEVKTILFLVVYSMAISMVVSASVLKQDNIETTKTFTEEVNGKQLINIEITTNQSSAFEQMDNKPTLKIRLPFAGSGCQCQNRQCTCCAAIHVQGLDFDRQACAVLNYNPSQLISFDVLVNDSSSSIQQQNPKTVLTTKEPKNYCVPVLPFSPLGPIDFCVRLSGIKVVRDKLHVCMKMMTRVAEQPVLNLSMECIDLDLEPEAAQVASTPEPTQSNSDVFDPIVEGSNSASPSSTSAPENTNKPTA